MPSRCSAVAPVANLPVEEVPGRSPSIGLGDGGPGRPGPGPGAPGHEAAVRDDPVGRRPGRDARRPAGEVAGLPPPQPGEAGPEDLQRPGPRAGRGRDGQDGRGHAPGQAPGDDASAPDPTDRILFTTYTANLAENVEADARDPLRPDAVSRIEVVHLHAWAVRFLKAQGVEVDIADRGGDRPVLGGGAGRRRVRRTSTSASCSWSGTRSSRPTASGRGPST